jgi:hypothetical protein
VPAQTSSTSETSVITRGEAVDASPDVDGIVHDLPSDDDARSMSRHARIGPRALERPERAHGSVWADLAFGDASCRNRPVLEAFREWRDPDSNRGHHDFQRVAARRSGS